MDIAIEKGSMKVVELLSEAIAEEIPDKVKLQQLSKAMYIEDTDEATKRFSELLRSLTPELVRRFLIFSSSPAILVFSGEYHSCQ